MANGQSYIWQDDSLRHRFVAEDFDLSSCLGRAGSRLLGGGRGASCRVRYSDQDCVLRLYRRGGLVQHVVQDRYLWTGHRSTRPYLEQRVAQRALEYQLPVAPVVAYQVQRVGLFYRAAIISRFLPHRATLAGFLTERSMPRSEWLALGDLIRLMHDAGIDHPDLNANNILVSETSDFYLIDFDKARVRNSPGNWRRANLDRLLRSLHKISTLNVANGLSLHFDEGDWQALLEGYR